MMEWYFEQTTEKIWLGTEQNSFVKIFIKRGWNEVGIPEKDEINFEMNYDNWTTATNIKY